MNGPAQFWLAIPELVSTEPLPWWAYALMVVGLTLAGGVIRLELLHYRAVQTGKLIPRITMDLIVAAKDREIERLMREADRWNAAYHITQQALVESMEAVEENTDALRALAPTAVVRHTDPPTRTSMNAEATNARRNRERG
jgi:hypothetical protein